MQHKLIILALTLPLLCISLFQYIKNRPEHLLHLGIRGLFAYFFIYFTNSLCSLFALPSVIVPNPITLLTGTLLGFPGILLLYLSGIYFLAS